MANSKRDLNIGLLKDSESEVLVKSLPLNRRFKMKKPRLLTIRAAEIIIDET